LKWDAVGSILKQTKRKHQLTIKTCIKYLIKNLQPEAARIITRLRKGTSHEKLYTELIHVNLWELLGGRS
jgi:hypothetical protein